MSDEKLDTQVRQEQITQAALEIVASQGVRRLSIAAVARRVGLVPSGIYRHFRSKDEMLDAVLDLLQRRLTANAEAAKADSPDPLECLRSLLIRHIRFIREGRAIPQIIFSDGMHAGHPERKGRIHRILTGYLAHVIDLVRAGQQQGRIRPELDPQTVAVMFLGMIMPAGMLWHLSDGGFDVTRHAARAWPMFQQAVGTNTI